MDPFKGQKFATTEDGLGKLSNTANLIAIFERLLELTTNKLLQKENPETILPIARTRREAMKFRKCSCFFDRGNNLSILLLRMYYLVKKCVCVFEFC